VAITGLFYAKIPIKSPTKINLPAPFKLAALELPINKHSLQCAGQGRKHPG
jgi:hypothetical protein